MLAFSLVSAALAANAIATPFTSPVETSSLFPRALSSGCSTTGTASCKNTTAASNLCCFESPGGLLMQTQFWDTNPSTGPSNSWTIHGKLMARSYWVDINGENEQFWEVRYQPLTYARVGQARHMHEVHTFLALGYPFLTIQPSTFKTACLPSGSAKGAEVALILAVAYFQTVVKLFKGLPTYTWLANAGITPSSTATHTLASLTSALKAASGVTPALDCTSGSLNAISWYHNLKGSGIDGNFVLIDAPFAGSCGSTGIKYPLKSGSTVTTTSGSTTTKTTTTATTTQTSDGSLPTKATIHAIQSGASVGGLLTLGTWSTQTLATMTLAGSTSSFTMSSSKGVCGVSSGVLACGSGVASTSFSAVTSGSNLLLASGGSTAFSSSGIPSGSTVYTINTGSSGAQDLTLAIVSA
ncbi:hypothetical protein DXG01_009913 [Tephrocybe rancida]|nr:hypothetical protein DXG01_009913 [Tephrocybe rancida]